MRQRAEVYRTKGYPQVARDLEREADEADAMARFAAGPVVAAASPRPRGLDAPARVASAEADDDETDDDEPVDEVEDGETDDEATTDLADLEDDAPRRLPGRPRKTFKPGTRVTPEKPEASSTRGSWWMQVKPGESMTAAAEAQKDNMRGSRGDRLVPSGKVND